jgi:hypothetical protein
MAQEIREPCQSATQLPEPEPKAEPEPEPEPAPEPGPERMEWPSMRGSAKSSSPAGASEQAGAHASMHITTRKRLQRSINQASAVHPGLPLPSLLGSQWGINPEPLIKYPAQVWYILAACHVSRPKLA